MVFWRRVLVEAIGAASPHPLLEEKAGEGRREKGKTYPPGGIIAVLPVSTTVSLHLCPWHAQADVILGLPVLVHGSERSPLSSVFTGCVMADTH